MVKLVLIALLLGPQVSWVSAIPESQRTAGEQVGFNTARWIPRWSILIALPVVMTVAMLARS
ncbi:MAG TPA: hypothetical protein PKD12_18625 [Nitrospira sp.]|nr:hypothetical protein [Nitrospira sp.]